MIRSEATTATTSASPPPSHPLTRGGSPDLLGQQAAPETPKHAPTAASATDPPRQGEKTSLESNGAMSIDKEANPNTDGLGRAGAAPELTTAGGDSDLVKEDPQPSRGSGGGGGPGEGTTDGVDADVPGGNRVGRDVEGVRAGGGGSRPRLPLPMGPAVSRDIDRADTAQASSSTAAHTAGTPSGSSSRRTIATAVEGGTVAKDGGCPTRSSHEAARLGPSSRPEIASSRTSSKASAGALSPSPDRVVVAAPPRSPPSSQSETRKKRVREENENENENEEKEEGAQAKTKGERRRRKEGSMPTTTTAGASGGGGAGGGGGRGSGLARIAAAGMYGRDGAGSGPEGQGARGSRHGKDAYSTVVWYRTVVACLTAASC